MIISRGYRCVSYRFAMTVAESIWLRGKPKFRPRRSCGLDTIRSPRGQWEIPGLTGMRAVAGSLGGRDVFEMRQTLSPWPFLIFISSFRICIPRLWSFIWSEDAIALSGGRAFVVELFCEDSRKIFKRVGIRTESSGAKSLHGAREMLDNFST